MKFPNRFPPKIAMLGLCFAIGFYVLAKERLWETGSGIQISSETRDQQTARLNQLETVMTEVIAGFRGILLTHENQSIFIDPCVGPEELKGLGFAKPVQQILLTRHDRHISDFAQQWLKLGVPVFCSAKTKEILNPDQVNKYWKEIVPLRTSRVLHFMPENGIECKETPKELNFGPWKIHPELLPGPAPDQQGFFITNANLPGKSWLTCGHLTTGNGKIFAPYTTDWDHWTDAGLKVHSQSIEKVLALKPKVVLPALGSVIEHNPEILLTDLKARIDEAGFLKSFERFSKKRLGNQPNYAFLAREQAESGGAKTWSRISKHLWNTGNTFVLTSETGDYLVMDPWDPNSARQIPLLHASERLGNLEGIFCSHAHFDHFDGIYSILERLGTTRKPKIWATKLVAEPLENPFKLWAPFLDQRKIVFDQKFDQGETFVWREYQFRFHDFSGQSRFTQAIEATIDGHHCLFTADNFFHQDQFSGSGGWMGMNRSSPLSYAQAAKKVLDIRPEWVLAEHGGTFVFDAEDFRRRELWGKAAAKAADALCLSGNHLIDWDPHRIRCEPILLTSEDPNGANSSLVLNHSGQIYPDTSIRIGKPKDWAFPEMASPKFTLRTGQTQREPFPWNNKKTQPTERRTVPLWENGKISQVDCFQIRK